MSVAAPRLVERPVSSRDLVEPIRDVSHEILRLIVPEMVAEGMAPSTFWPLHHLDRTKERHPSRLARRLGVTPAACTASVDQLVERGYVVRRPSEADRRQIELAVTPKGHRALEAVWRGFATSLEERLVGIPPDELAVTARTLSTVARILRGNSSESRSGERP